MQQQIDNTPFARQIRLVGVVQNVPEFLGQLDMLVVCSESEGLSNSVLESMAAGLPVVATDVEGNRTLLADKERGLLQAALDQLKENEVLLIRNEKLSALGQMSSAAEWSRRRSDRSRHYPLRETLHGGRTESRTTRRPCERISSRPWLTFLL